MEPNARAFRSLMLSYRPEFGEILTCVLNVSKSEARTYEALYRHQNVDVHTLANELNRSKNTVREQLSALQKKCLVARDTRITKQGRHYTYAPFPPSDSKEMLLETIKTWKIYVSNRIEHLADDPMGDAIRFRSTATSDSTANVPKQLLHGEHPALQCIATCVFGMKGPVLKQYLHLLDHPENTAREIAAVQGLARSTVSSRLNILQDRGLACPVGREIETGTRMAYEYIPRPWEEVKPAMKDQLEKEWVEHVEKTVDDFYQTRNE